MGDVDVVVTVPLAVVADWAVDSDTDTLASPVVFACCIVVAVIVVVSIALSVRFCTAQQIKQVRFVCTGT